MEQRAVHIQSCFTSKYYARKAPSASVAGTIPRMWERTLVTRRFASAAPRLWRKLRARQAFRLCDASLKSVSYVFEIGRDLSTKEADVMSSIARESMLTTPRRGGWL